MPRPLLRVEDLGALDASLDASARDAFEGDVFGDGHATFVGAVQTAWRGDFTESGGCWDRIAGAWTGPAPIRAVPKNLRVQQGGALAIDTSGPHPVWEIEDELPFMALCELQEASGVKSPLLFRVWDATTGAVVQTVIVPHGGSTLVADFEALPAGSYQLGAHCSGATRTPLSESEYQSLTGKAVSALFRYKEDDGTQYFYDYERNIGRLPSDSGHALRLARLDITAAGTQLDRPEWADFISSGDEDEGEWSQIRLQVGGGAWAQGGALIFPNPGPALRKRLSDSAWQGVAFDTMARGVSASAHLTIGNGDATLPGDWILAGTMSTDTGAVAAFWRVRGGVPTLMGWHPDPSDGLCQCAKRNHGINTIIELRDGTLLFLSECTLLMFSPSGGALSQRLIPYPGGADPGGYSLRLNGEEWNFFTENFGGTPAGEINFYNRLRELLPGRRTIGPGTVWHGRECSAPIWGDIWGWNQNAPFSDESATQSLAFLSQGKWQRTAYAPMAAAQYRWKSLIGIGGKLVSAGLRPNPGREYSKQEANLIAEQPLSPLWGVDSGREWREYFAPFFPLYITASRDEDGRECALAVARKVIADDGGTLVLTALEHVIRIYPESVKVCAAWDDVAGDYAWLLSEITDAGGDVEKLPAFLWWQVDLSVAPGGFWLPKEASPETGVYLALDVTEMYARYEIPDGLTMPYDTDIWDTLCFPIYEDGSIGIEGIEPGTSCETAACIVDKMPAGTTPIVVKAQMQGEAWQAVQVGDTNALDENSDRLLEKTARQYPALWLRVDSAADDDDLTSYTHRINFNRFESLPQTALKSVDVLMLIPSGSGDVVAHKVDRRG